MDFHALRRHGLSYKVKRQAHQGKGSPVRLPAYGDLTVVFEKAVNVLFDFLLRHALWEIAGRLQGEDILYAFLIIPAG